MRISERPLTPRECADWMGLTPAWIRRAINKGVLMQGRLVKLDAETLALNHQPIHRIHLDSFVTFLRAIGWKRLPQIPAHVPGELLANGDGRIQ